MVAEHISERCGSKWEFLRRRFKTGKLIFTAFLLAKACGQSSSGSRDGERIQSDIAKGVNVGRPEKLRELLQSVSHT